jgi:hypothetical protein
MTDFGDLVESLKREVAIPGTCATVFPTTTDDDLADVLLADLRKAVVLLNRMTDSAPWLCHRGKSSGRRTSESPRTLRGVLLQMPSPAAQDDDQVNKRREGDHERDDGDNRGVLGQGDDAGGRHGQQTEDGEDEAKGEGAAGWRGAADAGRRVVVVVGRVPRGSISHPPAHLSAFSMRLRTVVRT